MLKESEGGKNAGEIFETEVKLKLGIGFRHTYRRRTSSFIMKVKALGKISKLRCWFSCTESGKKNKQTTKPEGQVHRDRKVTCPQLNYVSSFLKQNVEELLCGTIDKCASIRFFFFPVLILVIIF